MNAVVDILIGAADYIEQYGWHQYDAFDYASKAPRPPACAFGAMMAVCNDDNALFEARNLVNAHVGRDLVYFNDTPGRTKDQVVTALREAARLDNPASVAVG